MKVEVGESIIYSWLRHIKCCQIVQLNWKISPTWITEGSLDSLQEIMDKANDKFHNLFKKTKTIKQLLRQAEIDGLGINIHSKEIYAVDVAFHESGLKYGSKEETALRVTKKYLRTIFVLESYFEKKWNTHVYFVSPKITPGTYNSVEIKLEELKIFLKGEKVLTNISLIGNRDFYTEILKPINEISGSLSDTSELFLRSMQLMKMFRIED